MSPAAFPEPPAGEPTILRGMVKDPVDDTPIAGAKVRVGPRVTRTGPDGTFEVRVGRRRTGNLKTRFVASGYVRYETATAAGTETNRTIYLFPDHPVRLQEHDGLVAPELLRQQFDLVWRDVLQIDRPRWMTRWKEAPRVVRIATRVIQPNGEGTAVAGRKIEGELRRYVRRIIEETIGPLSAGRLEEVRVRFWRMKEGETIVRDVRDYYERGEIRVFFRDDLSFNLARGSVEADAFRQSPAGGWTISTDLDGCRDSQSLSDCLTIVSAHMLLVPRGLWRELRQGFGGTVRHELGHTLGMDHPSMDPDGTAELPLCSTMQLWRCDSWTETIGAVPHVDRVLARLAHTREPGNHPRDRDPER